MEKTCETLRSIHVPDNMSRRDFANNNANFYLYSFLEYTKYNYDADFWQDRDNPIATGIRIAIAKYISVSTYLDISFYEYISCLSSDFSHSALKKARELNQIPNYLRKNAKKYKIERRYSCPSIYLRDECYE